jgi:hypothetical protein
MTICDAGCENADGDECRCRCRGRFHKSAKGLPFDFNYGADVPNRDGTPGSVVSCRLSSEALDREIAKQIYAEILRSFDPIHLVRHVRDIIEQHLGRRQRRSGDQYWRLTLGKLPPDKDPPFWSRRKRNEVQSARIEVSYWTTALVGPDLDLCYPLELMLAIALSGDLSKAGGGALKLATSHDAQIDAALAFVFLDDAAHELTELEVMQQLKTLAAAHTTAQQVATALCDTLDETTQSWEPDKQSQFAAWRRDGSADHGLCKVLLSAVRVVAKLDAGVSATAGLIGQTVENNLLAAGTPAPLATMIGFATEKVTDRAIGAIPPVAAATGLLPMLRGLTVLSCPDLASHKDVANECLVPLVKTLAAGWLSEALENLAEATKNVAAATATSRFQIEPIGGTDMPPPTLLITGRRIGIGSLIDDAA